MPGVTEAFFRSPKLGEWTDDIAPGLILVVRRAKTGRLRDRRQAAQDRFRRLRPRRSA